MDMVPANFRAALARVPPDDREPWIDELFGLGELPTDGPALPPGCVPYLPCSLESLQKCLELAAVQANDVFVDIGAGIGRVTMLAHLLTGAEAIGIEIQPALAQMARVLVARMKTPGVSVIEGDAAGLLPSLPRGSVFFLYCPFSGDRLERVIDDIATIAATRTVRICTVDLPPLARPWLVPIEPPGALSGEIAVYRSLPVAGSASRGTDRIECA